MWFKVLQGLVKAHDLLHQQIHTECHRQRRKTDKTPLLAFRNNSDAKKRNSVTSVKRERVDAEISKPFQDETQRSPVEKNETFVQRVRVTPPAFPLAAEGRWEGEAGKLEQVSKWPSYERFCTEFP